MASRNQVKPHEGKLTALHEVGEAIVVCRVSPAFLYCAAPEREVAHRRAANVTPQPPETSILYRHPRSTRSPTS
jgi:hypothetical protein